MPLALSKKMQDVLQWAVPFADICFRCVSLKFGNAEDIVSTRGSFEKGGRYNSAGTFGVLYLSCDIHTSFEEIKKYLLRHGFEVDTLLPCIIVGIKVNLNCVLNLTDANMRRRLGIAKQSLIAPDWEMRQDLDSEEALTQQIGRQAREAGFEAILVPSAVWRGNNLNVFPDCVLTGAGSSLQIINPHLLPLIKR
jgi:RES domain-containing protein